MGTNHTAVTKHTEVKKHPHTLIYQHLFGELRAAHPHTTLGKERATCFRRPNREKDGHLSWHETLMTTQTEQTKKGQKVTKEK